MNGVPCCGMISGLNGPSLLPGASSLFAVVHSWTEVKLLSLECCPAGLTAIKAKQAAVEEEEEEEEGLMVHIFPVFLHPRTLLWFICSCLWENRRRVSLPSALRVVLTVQCGGWCMFAISIQLWLNKRAKLKSHWLQCFSSGSGRADELCCVGCSQLGLTPADRRNKTKTRPG